MTALVTFLRYLIGDPAVLRKALVAGGSAGAGAVGVAMLDGSLTGAELVAAGGVALAGLVGTYATPNAPLSGRHAGARPGGGETGRTAP